MQETPSLEAVLAQRSYEAVGARAPEGSATRVRVKREDGRRGLLYRWPDVEPALRAAWCHAADHGAQLFAVPELVESGPGWILVGDVEGTPLSELAEGRGVDVLEAVGSPGARIVEGVGSLLRKLHNIPARDTFGDVLSSEEKQTDEPSQWLTFNGYVAAQLEYLSEHLRRRGLPDETLEELSTSIADMRHELASFHPRNPASLTHGHLSLEHVWVDPDSREVLALTGFEHACFLPREADIAFLLWIDGIGRDDALTRAFYKGYGAARTMDVQRRERFYRRLVAFQALFGMKGEVALDEAELVGLTRPIG